MLQHWNEGRLGTQSGESLYCTNPTLKFQEGNKTAVDASKRYNKQTIQMIAAMFYYYDENKCNGVSSNYDYLLKQCAVWWIMNEVHHWYGDMIQIETGNSVACGNGHWISTHKSEYYHKGLHGRKRIINISRMHMGLFMKEMDSRSVNGAEHTSQPEQGD